ncbi:glycerate kinase [Spirosoma utsteinense]|uniref:Glycerate kinase n=1 Tax=Spirosoma utsteinense TaxID=2585773 RepID=A0ABR6WBZ4_9BACT|nr:glycerate kinase [Spirosoma utsteinense]MBC3788591.1 glycerate kinase [Spirosoma utsteinense]MBC3794088.1 glycerate kinase [Spirosoma utsteinense]
MKPTRILIAPNAFKHSLDATDAALAIQEGLLRSRLDCTCVCFPVGDGGDGTGALMIEKHRGALHFVDVADPFGRSCSASFGLVDEGTTAIIEMAGASGIRLIKPEELDPLRATSYGTGQLMKQALDEGVNKLVLAIGGSATVDGGTGILRALGVRFLDVLGQELSSPVSLTELARIDVSNLDQRLSTCAVTILCDVDNTLLGDQGSAAVFGPQKGATPECVRKLETSLATFANIALQQTGIDMRPLRHGGAAGGVAAGLHTFLNARLVNGIDFFLDFTDFDRALMDADLVITGEGSLDEQTLHGKGPYGVACRAKAKNLSVVGLAGKIPLEPSESLNAFFDTLLAIGNGPADLVTALEQTKQNLIRTACQLGNLRAS